MTDSNFMDVLFWGLLIWTFSILSSKPPWKPLFTNPIKGWGRWLNREQAKEYVNSKSISKWGTDTYFLFDKILADHEVYKSWFGYYKKEDLDRVINHRKVKFRDNLNKLKSVEFDRGNG